MNIIFVFSFVGCILETAFALIISRRLEIRKTTRFLPFCPVYGFGAAAMYFILTPFSDYPIVVALLGIAVGTTVEYVYGFITLKIFNIYVWDYKAEPHNFRRLITPYFSLMWCGLSLIFIYSIAPTIMPLIFAFPDYISYILLALMALDAFFTIDMLLKIKKASHIKTGCGFLCPVLKKSE